MGNIPTTIRIWTGTEMSARKLIIEFLENAQKEAEQNKLTDGWKVRRLEWNSTIPQMAGSQMQSTKS